MSASDHTIGGGGGGGFAERRERGTENRARTQRRRRMVAIFAKLINKLVTATLTGEGARASSGSCRRQRQREETSSCFQTHKPIALHDLILSVMNSTGADRRNVPVTVGYFAVAPLGGPKGLLTFSTNATHIFESNQVHSPVQQSTVGSQSVSSAQHRAISKVTAPLGRISVCSRNECILSSGFLTTVAGSK